MTTSTRKRFTLEYPMKASPDMLFNYISTPSGLAIWFADDVKVSNEIYTFIWQGSEERAKMVSRRPSKLTKFSWIDRPDAEFVQFEVVVDALTGDVALMITDFDEEDEHERDALIYTSSIDKLRSTIGA